MIYAFKALQILGIMVLLVPIVYTVGLLSSGHLLSTAVVLPALLSVLAQAFISATLSVFLGFLSSVAVSTSGTKKQWHLYFGLIPQFLPSLLMIFAYIKFFSFTGMFPQSYWHVVCLHVLINIGLVSFLLNSPLQKALNRKLHLYASLNISKFKYLVLLCRGEMKIPLLYAWVLVFSYCITSFSIPLILAGDHSATSFEYLIYKNGFVEGNWHMAAFWGLLQLILVALLFKARPSILYGKEKLYSNILKTKIPFYWLGSMASIMLVLALIALPVTKLSVAWQNLSVDFLDMLTNTLLLVAWSLFFYSLYFWSHVVLIWNKWPWIFYQKFWSLSPILMGVYVLSLSSNLKLSAPGRLVLTALVLASFIFVFAFKFWIWPKFNELQKMKTKLVVLAIDKETAINHVLFSFFRKEFLWSVGYVVLFVLGDFAISSILLSDAPTLGLSIKNHLFKYQLAEAQILSLGLAGIAVISLSLLGGRYAINSKL